MRHIYISGDIRRKPIGLGDAGGKSGSTIAAARLSTVSRKGHDQPIGTRTIEAILNAAREDEIATWLKHEIAQTSMACGLACISDALRFRCAEDGAYQVIAHRTVRGLSANGENCQRQRGCKKKAYE